MDREVPYPYQTRTIRMDNGIKYNTPEVKNLLRSQK
jgi:hypothetical protein